jgi:ketosteroid isomerase-like protein
VGVLDDLAAAVWVQAYDTAWLSQDWTALEKFLAPDVAVMLAGFSAAICGRAAVLAHIRAIMSGAHVHEYNATDLTGHTAGTIGLITHRWQLDWSLNHKRCEASGRDILVLRRVREGWQLVWRAEAPRVVSADLKFLGRSVKFRTISA